ncbi:hypothetical protein E2562_035163 [Oryza meyeriana var. granulata]|uniref:Uncharacterized protein n=1 Tax=Oryza meyeriana var. granulata TaxID=110450 RepID=A0A6G1E7J7_9ORYZ|nr:hypothetical protein E2562_035163 [Oryza meyeriana var. granulata]
MREIHRSCTLVLDELGEGVAVRAEGEAAIWKRKLRAWAKHPGGGCVLLHRRRHPTAAARCAIASHSAGLATGSGRVWQWKQKLQVWAKHPGGGRLLLRRRRHPAVVARCADRLPLGGAGDWIWTSSAVPVGRRRSEQSRGGRRWSERPWGGLRRSGRRRERSAANGGAGV